MKNLRIRKKIYRDIFTFADCVSKIIITDNLTNYMADKLDRIKELKGVKIVNKLEKGTWY